MCAWKSLANKDTNRNGLNLKEKKKNIKIITKRIPIVVLKFQVHC